MQCGTNMTSLCCTGRSRRMILQSEFAICTAHSGASMASLADVTVGCQAMRFDQAGRRESRSRQTDERRARARAPKPDVY